MSDKAPLRMQVRIDLHEQPELFALLAATPISHRAKVLRRLAAKGLALESGKVTTAVIATPETPAPPASGVSTTAPEAAAPRRPRTYPVEGFARAQA